MFKGCPKGLEFPDGRSTRETGLLSEKIIVCSLFFFLLRHHLRLVLRAKCDRDYAAALLQTAAAAPCRVAGDELAGSRLYRAVQATVEGAEAAAVLLKQGAERLAGSTLEKLNAVLKDKAASRKAYQVPIPFHLERDRCYVRLGRLCVIHDRCNWINLMHRVLDSSLTRISA